VEIKITTNDLVSVIEAAKSLGWPKIRIYRWVARGTLLGVKLGGVLFIPVSEVERLKGKINEGQGDGS
jgi:excisionase family DNA binding protein